MNKHIIQEVSEMRGRVKHQGERSQWTMDHNELKRILWEVSELSE